MMRKPPRSCVCDVLSGFWVPMGRLGWGVGACSTGSQVAIPGQRGSVMEKSEKIENFQIFQKIIFLLEMMKKS